MREARRRRETRETNILLELNIDGAGRSEIRTECGFMNHMLELMSYHGRFDLHIEASGDTDVDFHHLVEDLGILLGEAFKEALGEKKGIRRYGQSLLPMDEALVLTAVDASGRAYLSFQVDITQPTVGFFDTELVEEFFQAFVRSSAMTLHIHMMSGKNTHHIIEASFKSVARALREAVSYDQAFSEEIPSSKGMI